MAVQCGRSGIDSSGPRQKRARLLRRRTRRRAGGMLVSIPTACSAPKCDLWPQLRELHADDSVALQRIAIANRDLRALRMKSEQCRPRTLSIDWRDRRRISHPSGRGTSAANDDLTIRCERDRRIHRWPIAGRFTDDWFIALFAGRSKRRDRIRFETR